MLSHAEKVARQQESKDAKKAWRDSDWREYKPEHQELYDMTQQVVRRMAALAYRKFPDIPQRQPPPIEGWNKASFGMKAAVLKAALRTTAKSYANVARNYRSGNPDHEFQLDMAREQLDQLHKAERQLWASHRVKVRKPLTGTLEVNNPPPAVLNLVNQFTGEGFKTRFF